MRPSLFPFVLATAALLPSSHPAAQGSLPWRQQAPLPTGLDIHDVVFRSRTEAYAATEGGQVLHTKDAGSTWTEVDVSPVSLWKLFFLDAQRGWAAGSDGIYWTTDGGGTWTKSTTVTGSVYNIQFADAQNGWACGNGATVYRSTDGGRTWSYRSLGGLATCTALHFVDATHGWVATNAGAIHQTTDGGRTWTLAASVNDQVAGLWFADRSEGFATGGLQGIRHTLDGGRTWQLRPGPTAAMAAFFQDRSRAWAAGAGIYATTDGWQTYTVQHSASGPELFGIGFADPSVGMATGEGGRILATGDGGATWITRSSEAMDVHELDVVDAAHAFAALEYGDVARTTNGGAQWEAVRVAGFSKYGTIEGVDFLDLHEGWATGVERLFGGDLGVVARSGDGGRTWQPVYVRSSAFLESVAAVAPGTAIACGNVPFGPAVVVRTTDSGRSWQSVAPSPAAFMTVKFIDSQRGWLAGGLIYRSDDGGLTWQQQPSTPGGIVMDLSFCDRQNGWAAAWYEVLHTADGGDSWAVQQSPLFGYPTVVLGVHAVDPATAWVVGTSSGRPFAARTLDGGKTWQQHTLPTGTAYYQPSLTDAAFLSASHGFVAGNPRVDNGGIWHSGTVPPGFSLLTDRFVQGGTATFRADGALAGAPVAFVVNLAGPGPGPCVPPSGPCLGLVSPFWSLGALAASASGRAELKAPLPATVPFVELHGQAATLVAAGIVLSNVSSSRIEP